MKNNKKYFYGKWNTQALHDLCVAWNEMGPLDAEQLKWCKAHADKSTLHISWGEKYDRAQLMMLGGDISLTLLFCNDDHLVVLSKDACIEVLTVINRKEQVQVWQEESH